MSLTFCISGSLEIGTVIAVHEKLVTLVYLYRKLRTGLVLV